MEKLYLPFYYTWEEITAELSDDEFGKLVRAVLIFSKSGQTTQLNSSVASIAYKFITDTIRRSQKNAEAGRKGMAVRWKNNSVNNDANNAVNNDLITINKNINTNINNLSNPSNEVLDKENNNNNNIVYNSACAQEEQQNVESFPHVEMEIMRYFAKEHFESNAEDFIAYNKARNWKGFGGEDVREDYSRYADRWEEEHLRRIGFKT